jgi:SRSO17 transposase
MGAQHLPGEELWLVGKRRSTGELNYLSYLPPQTTMKQLAGAIKARWISEQGHQKIKEELELDHFEGRSWTGLHRHCLMSMIAFAFLQNQRLKKAKGGKKNRNTATTTEPASHSSGNPHRARTSATITVPACRKSITSRNLPK